MLLKRNNANGLDHFFRFRKKKMKFGIWIFWSYP